jgi:hypothetical protein
VAYSEVLLCHSPGETEDAHEKPSLRVAGRSRIQVSDDLSNLLANVVIITLDGTDITRHRTSVIAVCCINSVPDYYLLLTENNRKLNA